MSHLNIRLSSKVLINNGISFKSGGNLHNKLFSFSGTTKYKSKKTINKKLNCCGLEFLKFVNIDYYYFPKITFITLVGFKEPTISLLLSTTVSISLLLRIDSANVSIIASLDTLVELELFES